ncbi:MAG: hypothetical protein AAFN50_10060 [Pseudomonadota bacterium]
MTDLDRLASMAEIFSAVIVVGGIIFALLQMRQTRQQRRELAAIELFRSFGSPQFTEAYRNVLQYPDGLTAAELKRRFPDGEHYAMMIATTMENIGVMMFQRIVPSVVVHHLIGSSTTIMWRKLERWAEELRLELDAPNAFEWFQWLAERMEEMEGEGRPPAYEQYNDWKPTNLTSEI